MNAEPPEVLNRDNLYCRMLKIRIVKYKKSLLLNAENLYC